MRLLTVSAAAGLALAAGAAQAAQAASVEVKDAVARVVVIPEDRKDIKVEVLTRRPNLPLDVRTRGDRVVIDGGLDRRIRSCHGSGEKASVTVIGVGEVNWEDMPQIVIRTPKDTVLQTGGAVFGSIGRTQSLEFSNAGCGDWTVANVQGRMRFNLAGAGAAPRGAAGAAGGRSAGAGDGDLPAGRGRLDVDVAGSGDVDVAQAAGPVDVKIAGSGDVKVGSGSAGDLTVTVAGSGNVDFNATARSLKARVVGSGDIRVKSVTGSVVKTVLGSGAVRVG
jgi:hypothetical protein